MKKPATSNRFHSILINPILFIAAFSLIFGVILFKTYSNIGTQQTNNVIDFAERIASNIELKLDGNLDYLKVLVKERANGRLTEQTFNNRLSEYLIEHPEFINITWIDSAFVIKTVAPIKTNSFIIGLPVELTEPKKASRLAKEKREPVYTKPFEAIQSNTSFEVWVPVFKENVFMGLFAGVYSCDKLLKSCLPDEDYGNTRVSLIEANANILASYPKSYNETKGVMYEKYLAPLYNTMGVRVETISVQTFGWTMIILISLIVVLVFSFAYSLFKVSIENRLRKEAQNELEKREMTLKQQNIEYSLLNAEYKSQNENLVRARMKAEESDRLKSAFLANMSHEIRTPMNGILGFSELLKAPNLSGEEQQRYISIIEKSGVRMLNIINDIIDISKIESGSMNLSIAETNVNDILEYIYTFFKPEMVKKGIQPFIKRNLPAGEAIINTDREKFIAIMTNLVKNAIKYTNTGTIEFGCDRKGSYVEFFVKDTGIGVPEDRQQAIFERFIQADISDTMALQGAGLGLSITKAYVEMLNGKIWMESEEGKGSIFYFTLPCNAEPEEKSVARKTVADEGTENRVLPEVSGLKILIAEDDETSALFGSISVQKISREIIKTKNGLEAVDICRKHPDIDLILMDIQMPGLNGHDATRQIRQFNSKVVIIAQTAYGLSGDREKTINAGCNDYIAKPINKNELLALIQKYFTK